jgi:hypothetical protein
LCGGLGVTAAAVRWAEAGVVVAVICALVLVAGVVGVVEVE